MRYYTLLQILDLALAFFLFGAIVGSVNFIYKKSVLLYKRIKSNNILKESAAEYIADSDKIDKKINKFRFSLLEFFAFLFVCFLFFLISFYFLDAEIRFYTVVLCLVGFATAQFLTKRVERLIEAFLFPPVKVLVIVDSHIRKAFKAILFRISKVGETLRNFVYRFLSAFKRKAGAKNGKNDRKS